MLIICPEATCRAQNEASNTKCIRCNAPLEAYVQLLTHPNHLFNQGLLMARSNKLGEARDLFAAVVYWCPNDLEARNALALACFAQKDFTEAQKQWNLVLVQSRDDKLAKQGIEAVQQVQHEQHGSAQSQDKKGKHNKQEVLLHSSAQPQGKGGKHNKHNKQVASIIVNKHMR